MIIAVTSENAIARFMHPSNELEDMKETERNESRTMTKGRDRLAYTGERVGDEC